MAKNVGVLVLVVCCALQVAQLEAAECRGGFPKAASCGQQTKDLGGCLVKQFNAVIKTLAPGNKAMNLASIDPLVVPYPQIAVTDGKNTVLLKECTLTGGRDSKLSNFVVNFPASAKYDLEVPKFNLQCKKYTMSGGFLNAKKNEGYFFLSMPNYKAGFTLAAELFTLCKEQYLRITSIDSTLPSSSDFVAFFSGLGKNQLKKDSLKPLIAKALAKAQSRFTFDFLTKVYGFLPQAKDWFPNNTLDNVPFCFQPRPAQCPKQTN